LAHPSRGKDEPPIRLITTLLDAAEAPAAELAGLYGERWEEENAFDELKPISVVPAGCCARSRRRW
jgi:hypothetical protein